MSIQRTRLLGVSRVAETRAQLCSPATRTVASVHRRCSRSASGHRRHLDLCAHRPSSGGAAPSTPAALRRHSSNSAPVASVPEFRDLEGAPVRRCGVAWLPRGAARRSWPSRTLLSRSRYPLHLSLRDASGHGRQPVILRRLSRPVGRPAARTTVTRAAPGTPRWLASVDGEDQRLQRRGAGPGGRKRSPLHCIQTPSCGPSTWRGASLTRW
jgi:hypothetical protein